LIANFLEAPVKVGQSAFELPLSASSKIVVALRHFTPQNNKDASI
jgi:hypothetical protein